MRSLNYNFLFVNVVISNFFLNKVLMGSKKILWNSYNKPFGVIFLKKVCVFSFDYMHFCYRKALFFVFHLFSLGYNKFVFFVNGLPFFNSFVFSSRFSTKFFRRVTRSRYVVRWVPGLLTNFKLVGLGAPSKKNRTVKRNFKARWSTYFGLTKIMCLKSNRSKKKHKPVGQVRFPNLIFFFSSSYYFSSAIKEALSLGIPSVGIVDSDSSFHNLSYPIPGNDDSLRSVLVYLRIFSECIFRGVTLNLFNEKIFLNLKTFDEKKSIKRRVVRRFYRNLRLSLHFLNFFKLKKCNFNFYCFEFFGRFLKYFTRFNKLLKFVCKSLKKPILEKCMYTVFKKLKCNLNVTGVLLYRFSITKVRFFYYNQYKKLKRKIFLPIRLKVKKN